MAGQVLETYPCSRRADKATCEDEPWCQWFSPFRSRSGSSGGGGGFCSYDIKETAKLLNVLCADMRRVERQRPETASVLSALLADLERLGAVPPGTTERAAMSEPVLCNAIARGLIAHLLLREHGSDLKSIRRELALVRQSWAQWLLSRGQEPGPEVQERLLIDEWTRATDELDRAMLAMKRRGELPLQELHQAVGPLAVEMARAPRSDLWKWAFGGALVITLTGLLLAYHRQQMQLSDGLGEKATTLTRNSVRVGVPDTAFRQGQSGQPHHGARGLLGALALYGLGRKAKIL